MSAADIMLAWEAMGNVVEVGGHDLFVIDAPPSAGAAPDATPLLVLHGFPTSSIDFSAVLPALAAGRRVVLFDLLGFGMSAKPDQAYSLLTQADLALGVLAHLGLDRVDLLTHDVGDSVGAELLARSLEGDLGVEIGRRVLTNGSIYYDLTQFSDGQTFLLELPDEMLPAASAPDVDLIGRSLEGTFGPAGGASHPDPDLVRAAADLVLASGGNRLLPRTIRYIEERRRLGDRWADAIERHPSPLAVVWGDADPIAVWPMTQRLVERRPDATLTRLEGVGHYPMVEAPEAFSGAVLGGL
jgi:pimeloyl-ACP methyl ester carboxylesterase